MRFSDIPAFYNKPEYIEVLSNSIGEKLKDLDYEHLLFSYHGVPKGTLEKAM